MSEPRQTVPTPQPPAGAQEPYSVPVLSPRQWARANLFNTWYNALFTVVFGGLLASILWRALRFVFISGRWEIVEANLTLFMVGRFPRDQLHRVWIAMAIMALAISVANGMLARERDPEPWTQRLRKIVPLLGLVAVLLTFAQTLTPLLLSAALGGVIAAGWALGRRLPARMLRLVPLLGIVAVLAAYLCLTAFGGVDWNRWGGLLLTLFLAVGGIVLSFPFGVLLALGRRSSLPAVRVVCVGYIELIRGVPLITLLFMGVLALGFFLPPGTRPGRTVSVLVAIVLFTAAYVAEIVRGGLQGVPRGQVEAAQALGLSPLAVTRRIVLPQGLRNVIPALVGQFISLFKDTSLAAIVGLTEVLEVARIVPSQGRFLGQGLQAESLAFAGFVYWTFCYSMSRASQRLERRLGVGER